MHSAQQVTEALVALVRRCHARGWTRATSGNFSARVDSERFMMSASGRDKGAFGPDDFLLCDADGRPLAGGRPSAETPLHAALYRRDPAIGAVAHTHSVAATVLSHRHSARGALVLSDYEMAKALAGNSTHDDVVRLPIVANDQDTRRLAETALSALDAVGSTHGYLIAGHGLYTWGSSVEQVGQHAEAIEFLLECALHG